MSACSQCGTAVKPTDKFCNVCGAPIARTSSTSAPPAGTPFGATAYAPQSPPAPAGQGGQGGPPQAAPPTRCQFGHEIAPGASYCPQGHPIALDQMQFAGDGYGAGPYAPPGAAAYAPRSAYPAPAAAPQGYGPPPQAVSSPAYTPPPAQAVYASAFGNPAGAPQGQGYRPPPAYGPPPGHMPPQPPGYGYAAEPVREAPPKVLRGFLVAYGTNPSGEFWPLTAGRLIVGRYGTGDGLDIPLQDPTISSRHAAFVVDGPVGSVTIEDTGSTNGTFVNDEHIGYGGRRELRDGDRVRFGGYTTVVKVIGRV